MDLNNQDSQLTQVLNNVLGLIEDDSLLSQNYDYDQDSDGGYGDGPEVYLHKRNRSEQEESISASDGEEYKVDDEWEEDEDTMNDDNLSYQQYIEGPVVGMVFDTVESLLAFYKEHSHSTGFGVVKKSSKKKGCEYSRQISRSLKRSLEAHDIARIRPPKSIRHLEVQAGGPNRIGSTPKDC
ncbi:hypothetical protein H5410_004934 [Solanum commersonii]|uniref:Uncharacterized protein n=1 Tax=Solanum commersonii TaxID=4109 RepID=A0A9J6A680_SOLCO|nr:hypothetical protein H5410_004934 [Solanum commersonii]